MELNTININKNLVFDKTLKGIPGVRLENRKVFCAPGPRTKYFERIFCRSITLDIILYFIHALKTSKNSKYVKL